MYPSDWSADSSSIVYHERRAGTGYDISLLDLRTRAARPLVHTPYEEAQGQLGAGGRLAYTSHEADEFNVYVRPLDSDQGAVRISTKGGADPRWRADGRELFYVSKQGELMAAEITDAPLKVGRLTPLFPVRLPLPSSPYPSNFVVTRNGQRFLVKVPLELPESRPISLTLNWTRRLPAGS